VSEWKLMLEPDEPDNPFGSVSDCQAGPVWIHFDEGAGNGE